MGTDRRCSELLTRRELLGRAAGAAIALSVPCGARGLCAPAVTDDCVRLCNEHADRGDFRSAREALAEGLDVPEGRSAQRDLVDILAAVGYDPGAERDPARASLRAAIDRVAVKTYECAFTLSPLLASRELRAEARARGCLDFSMHGDVADQTMRHRIARAQRAEERADAAGNQCIRVWPDVGGDPQVVVTATVMPRRYEMSGPLPKALPEAVRPYLGRTPLIDPSGTTAKALGARMAGQTVGEILEHVADWCRGVRPEDPSQSDSETVLRERRGQGWEFTMGVVALLRAAGMAARQVYALGLQGDNYGNISTNPLSAQLLLVEVYDPEGGWAEWTPDGEVARPRARLRETRPNAVRLFAEDPLSTETLGSVAAQVRRSFYGYKYEWDKDRSDLANVDVRLTGLSLA